MKFELDENYIGCRDNNPADDCDCFQYGIPHGDCVTDGHYMCTFCLERDPFFPF